jgi:hypothetical protein
MSNRLADATSPYLQQHQDNPVDWWEWSEEALTVAKTLDRPILLSVGYAACHWCQVNIGLCNCGVQGGNMLQFQCKLEHRVSSNLAA